MNWPAFLLGMEAALRGPSKMEAIKEKGRSEGAVSRRKEGMVFRPRPLFLWGWDGRGFIMQVTSCSRGLESACLTDYFIGIDQKIPELFN